MQMMGFPTGAPFKGTPEQKTKMESQFIRKADFMTRNGTPIWNGEFGPVYADPANDADAASINQDRFNLLGEQLSIYDKYQIHWSIWLYKDIGVQGMMHTDPKSNGIERSSRSWIRRNVYNLMRGESTRHQKLKQL